MKKYTPFWLTIIFILAVSAVLAAGEDEATWLQGWLAFSLLIGLVVTVLFITWQLVIGKQVERSLLMAMAIAFLLRIWVSAALTQLLPEVGYADSQEHQAGYAFTDAYIRDRQAWELANTSEPIISAFNGQRSGDQYGGMMALEAWLYRTLSLDYHRQTLVVTLTAGMAALGVIFIWKASQLWLGKRYASLAAWIFALYPESVLLGSSQMREAFVITAVAIMIYSLTRLFDTHKANKNSLSWLVYLLVGIAILGLFQPPMLIISLSLLFLFWLLDIGNGLYRRQPRAIAIGVLFACLLFVALGVAASILANLPSLHGSGILGIFGDWIAHNFAFQTYLTERSSGMFQKLVESAGEQWTWLLVMVYGIAQPVLPAIVGDPSAAPIMRLTGFIRAAGWYALAPLLIYGIFAALRAKSDKRRVQLIILYVAVWAWALIAAFNGGADQWDTPRYRTLLLAWQVLLATWSWQWARLNHDAWLGRWLAIEVVFVGLFTEWYASRYFPNWPHFDIFVTIATILAITAVIIIVGWLKDRQRQADYKNQ